MNFIDSHAHFDLCIEEKIEEEDLISGLAENNIEVSIQVALDIDGFAWARDFSRKHRDLGVLFSLGIHPGSPSDEDKLDKLSAIVNEIVSSTDKELFYGIGETGLDYYRMRQSKEIQMKSFEYQAGLADSLGLPLIVHSREAINDILKVLGGNKSLKGIMHCFSGDARIAGKVIDAGFLVSFAGNLTYKKAVDLHEAARYVPLDRVLFETDAPFLSPVPLRGKVNEPANVVHTYEFFAKLRNIPLDKLTEQVNENFRSLRTNN